jgi:uncharacterized protein GlcG (DUF336 family)
MDVNFCWREHVMIMKRVMVGLLAVGWALGLGLAPVTADPHASHCHGLPTTPQLQAFLVAAPTTGGDAGGLSHGTRMWGALVNRDGEVCAFATSTADPTQVWPGSQAIAKAKAYTANAFSLDALALSTARLYTFTQPGHSLWSLGQSNLFIL